MADSAPTTPIHCLLRSLAGSPCALAPERRTEFIELIQRFGITIDFEWAEDGVPLAVNHDTNTIRFDIPFAERLWACSFAYAQLLNVAVPLVPQGIYRIDEPEFAEARRLLVWAYSDDWTLWPDGLPTPSPTLDEAPATFEATEAFLCMCGWMLLHEIGHVVRGHGAIRPRSSDDYERLEYQADDFASEWILTNWREYSTDERVFVKRSLGGLFALSILATREVYHRTYGGFEHPDPLDRMGHYLERHCPEGVPHGTMTDPAWHAAVVIFNLHLVRTGRSIEPREYSSFRELLDAAERAM